MNKQGDITLDQFEAILIRDNEADRFYPRRYALRMLRSIIVVCFFMVIVTPVAIGEPIFVAGHELPFWTRVIAAVFTVGMIDWMQRRQRARTRRDSRAAAERMKKDYDKMTAPDWPWRALKMGLILGVSIAIPVGALIILVPTADDPESTTRLREGLLFMAGTFVWTIPGAFGIRWLTLASTRSLVKKSSEGR